MSIRATIELAAAGRALGLAIIVTGCAKVRQDDPRQVESAKTETKQHKAACASSAAYGRLKDIIFDRAVGERVGDRTNLNTLADYSTVRMDDPVVAGYDPSLDITRCKGSLILEIPPGAERGFAGARRLQSNVVYTAQAAADGSGFVYQVAGAESIIARLAAFNLTSMAFRPPPAIDEPQAARAELKREELAEPDMSAQPVPPPTRSVGDADQRSPESKLAFARDAYRDDVEPNAPLPAAPRGGGGEATIRAFYGALGQGRGAQASFQVVPEKRASGAFSSDALSRFYGRLPEPVRLTEVFPLDHGIYRVRYRYSAGRSDCDGSAVVRVTSRDGRGLISSIRALNGC